MSNLYKFLLLVTVEICCSELAEASLPFESIVYTFRSCNVRLHNYGNIQLDAGLTPVSIHTNMSFQVELPNEFRSPLLGHCLAIFHIQPNLESRITKLSERNNYWYRPRPRYTSYRYDIFIDTKDQEIYTWGYIHEVVLARDVNSHIFMILMKKYVDGLVLGNKMLIINKLQLSAHVKKVSKIFRMQHYWDLWDLQQIYIALNDLRNNWDVSWNLVSTDNPFFRPHGSFLNQDSASSEGSENYFFARMALGSNVSVTEWYQRGHPTIMFDYPDAPIMQNIDKRAFGFITCANVGTRTYKTGFLTVLIELAMTFDLGIYYSLVVTYVAPALWFGHVYHGMLKDGIQRQYWLKWDPFTWGIRALIWQAGDRRRNSKRFGWMTWLVTPWLLGAVVISYSFRGSNVGILNRPSVEVIQNTWMSMSSLRRANVAIVTDHMELASEWTMLSPTPDWYWEIGSVVEMNTSIAYVTYEDRANAVANTMGSRGRCADFSKVRRGHVGWWETRDWRARDVLMGTGKKGWKLILADDVWLLRRLTSLESESGIVGKWRKHLKEKKDGSLSENSYPWISSVSMRCNIKWLFVAGGASLAVALVVWLLEFVLWKQCSRFKWRSQSMIQRKRESAAVILVDTMQPAANSDQDKEPDASTESVEGDTSEQIVTTREGSSASRTEQQNVHEEFIEMENENDTKQNDSEQKCDAVKSSDPDEILETSDGDIAYFMSEHVTMEGDAHNDKSVTVIDDEFTASFIQTEPQPSTVGIEDYTQVHQEAQDVPFDIGGLGKQDNSSLTDHNQQSRIEQIT